MEVVPTGAALGAEMRGVDLRHVDAASFAAIQRAWVDHQVLLFRGQQLSDDDLIAFSRRFGALDLAPVQENGRRFVEGKPELYIVSNVQENGARDRQPGRRRAGVAHRHVLPGRSAQGEHALCDGDSAGRRQHVVLQHVCGMGHAAGRAEGAAARDCGSSMTAPTTAAAILREGVTPPTIRATVAGAPCIRWSAGIRKAGGRCCISAGGATPIWSGLELAESPRRCSMRSGRMSMTRRSPGRTSWRVGDLVMWDNRCTMHKREPFDSAARRIMHRTQIKGEARPAA